RIDLRIASFIRRAKPVGPAERDFADNPLDRPALIHKPRRQVIEQLGMAGLLTHISEIIERGDDAPSEHVVPDAIHGHPSRQRVIPPGDPFSELKASALFFANLRFLPRLADYLHEAAWDFRAELLRVAANVHFAIGDLRTFANRHHQVGW